jgi:predicted RNase H-like HicB family nuclease
MDSNRVSVYWFMKFRVVLEFDPVAKSYSAVCPELPGCASAGDTEEEAHQNIEEAIRLYLKPADLDLPQGCQAHRGHGWLNAERPGSPRTK